jgi:hypothetical protein
MASAVKAVADADKAKAAAGKPAEPKKIDLSTIALIGVAVGGIGTMVGGVLTGFLNLGVWMPVGVVGLILLISGPSMLIAWMKLRKRNLGPILDANGWAINNVAKMNIPFGASLTDMPRLPAGAERSLEDPYEDKTGKRSAALGSLLLLLFVLIIILYFVLMRHGIVPCPWEAR